jgi:ABC-type transporter Mla subunit MlaD
MALKSALNSFSQSTQKASQGMMSAAQDFEKHSQQVLSLIGGSATGKDREVASAIQQAQKAVKQAGAALQQASKTASQYGSSI